MSPPPVALDQPTLQWVTFQASGAVGSDVRGIDGPIHFDVIWLHTGNRGVHHLMVPLRLSIVALSPNMDPSIVQPTTLATSGIIPKDWRLSEGPIVAPMLARLRYDNGVVIYAEGGKKLLVEDFDPPDDPTTSSVPRIAAGLIRLSMSVHYTALGVNFTLFRELPDADAFLIERFLAKGSWNSAPLAAETLGLGFEYGLEDGTLLKASVQSGGVGIDEGDVQKGVLMSLNYHEDLEMIGPDKLADMILPNFASRLKHMDSVINAVIGEAPSD